MTHEGDDCPAVWMGCGSSSVECGIKISTEQIWEKPPVVRHIKIARFVLSRTG